MKKKHCCYFCQLFDTKTCFSIALLEKLTRTKYGCSKNKPMTQLLLCLCCVSIFPFRVQSVFSFDLVYVIMKLKQRKYQILPRVKLNHNICFCRFDITTCFAVAWLQEKDRPNKVKRLSNSDNYAMAILSFTTCLQSPAVTKTKVEKLDINIVVA